MLPLLITNADISGSAGREVCNILVEYGKIAGVLPAGQLPGFAHRNIDAGGHLVFPGGIDPHVHMHLLSIAGFSADDFESGSRAALAGGTTALIDFVTPFRGQSIVEALASRKKEAGKSLCDVKLHVSPVEWTKKTADELEHCVRNEGITSFKVYMAYPDTIGICDDDLLKVMKLAGKLGVTVVVHCEKGDKIERLRAKFVAEGKTSPFYHPLSRLPETEAEAVQKAIKLAVKAGCKLYVVHVSTRQALESIHNAQASGFPVYAETCPQYLLFDDSVYNNPFDVACAYVMSPPLRKREDREVLWQALRDGVVQTVGTDHCPFTLAQKRNGIDDFTKIPNGAGGVEHRMSLLYTYGVLQNRISLEKFVEVTSKNPALIFGWYPQKGALSPGSDADLVIWNREKRQVISHRTHRQQCDLNIYEGVETTGAPEMILYKGEPFRGFPDR